jgi:hypothetical protein
LQLIHDPCPHLHQPMPVPEQLLRLDLRRITNPYLDTQFRE